MRCVTVMYPYKGDARFDFDYYTRKHMPMAQKLIGKGIARTEVRKGISSRDGSPPTYICVSTIWIGDKAEYEANFARHGAEIMADLPNYTNVEPIVQIDEALV